MLMLMIKSPQIASRHRMSLHAQWEKGGLGNPAYLGPSRLETDLDSNPFSINRTSTATPIKSTQPNPYDIPQAESISNLKPQALGSQPLGGAAAFISRTSTPSLGGADMLGPKVLLGPSTPMASRGISAPPPIGSPIANTEITSSSNASTYRFPWITALKRSFQFQPREGRVFDWPRISSITLNQVISSRDFSQLEDILPHLTFTDISDTWKFSSSDFLHIIRLMQLELEYLMAIRQNYVQELRHRDYEAMTIHGKQTSELPPPGASLRNSEFLSSGNVAQEVGVAVQAVLSADAVNRDSLQRSLAAALTEVAALREELSRTGAMTLAHELQRAKDEEDRREKEWRRYREAWELEEKNRRMKLEQELYNKERLMNLERERLEKARLALELEQQKMQTYGYQKGAVNTGGDSQRAIMEQLRLIMAQLQMSQSQIPHMPRPSSPKPANAITYIPETPIQTRGIPSMVSSPSLPVPPVPPAVVGVLDTFKLMLSADHLPKMDYLSLTDPFAVVFTAKVGTRASIGEEPPAGYKLLDMTNYIMDTLYPIWHQPIVIEWDTEQDLAIHVQLWDLNTSKGNNISPSNYQKHKYIGSCNFTLSRISGHEFVGLKQSFPVVDRKGNFYMSTKGRATLNVVCTSLLAEQRAASYREASRRAEEENRLKANLLEQIAAREREANVLKDEINKKMQLQQSHAARMLAMTAYTLKVSGRAFPGTNTFVRIYATDLHKTANGLEAQQQKFVAMTETAKGTPDPVYYSKLTLYCASFDDQDVEFTGYLDLSTGTLTAENFDRLGGQFAKVVGSTSSRLSDLLESQVTLHLKVDGKSSTTSIILKAEPDPQSTELWKATAQQKIAEFDREVASMQEKLRQIEQDIVQLRETHLKLTNPDAVSYGATRGIETSGGSEFPPVGGKAGYIPSYHFPTGASSQPFVPNQQGEVFMQPIAGQIPMTNSLVPTNQLQTQTLQPMNNPTIEHGVPQSIKNLRNS